VLEKIRPIDYKLRYQIDKLVKTAVTGTTNASDPLNFKANPTNLMDEDTDSETEEEEDAVNEYKKKKKNAKSVDADEEIIAKYVPPRLTSMPYDDDDTKADKQEKIRERARKRALNSTLIDELKEDYLDTPVEISGGSRAQQLISKAWKERERYEEDNLVRLPMSKEDRHREKRLSTMGSLGDELLGRGSGGNNNSNKKKRKGGKTKKSFKKKKIH